MDELRQSSGDRLNEHWHMPEACALSLSRLCFCWSISVVMESVPGAVATGLSLPK